MIANYSALQMHRLAEAASFRRGLTEYISNKLGRYQWIKFRRLTLGYLTTYDTLNPALQLRVSSMLARDKDITRKDLS